jgi:lipopolysaccharide/colanic/teichoic acid biosynthesis glycosyltransferase
MSGSPSGKRVLDLAIATPLFLATLPLAPLVRLAMVLTHDPGPLLFHAVRVGRNGRPIDVLKIRTMRTGAPGGSVTGHEDPRITRIGRLLRRTKLDELPQLWNVVRGDMSLVGPRPEDPRNVDWDHPLHRRVFTALPGITGLAQLAYVNEAALLDGPDPDAQYRTEVLPRKLELDARYLDHQSLRLDVRIILATARRVLFR